MNTIAISYQYFGYFPLVFFNRINIITNYNSKNFYLVNFKKSFNESFNLLLRAKNLLLKLLYLKLISQAKDEIELYINNYQMKKDANTTK